MDSFKDILSSINPVTQSEINSTMITSIWNSWKLALEKAFPIIG